MLLFLLAVFVILIVFLYFRNRAIRQKMPPGPVGYPFIGNAFDIDPKRPLIAMSKWAEEYGPVYTIQVFGNYMVIANDLKTIQEITLRKSNVFSGRPSLFRFRYLNKFEDNLVLGQANNRWIHLKKATINGLRMQGTGLEKLETLSIELVNELCDSMESYNGKSFDADNHVHSAVTHIISSLLYGCRLSDDDIQSFIELDHRLIENTNPAGKGVELDLLPWLRFVPGLNKHITILDDILKDSEKCFAPRLQKHADNLDEDNLTCVVDYLIQFQRDFTNDNCEQLISDRQLLNTTRDLLFTGMMTTSRAIYALLLLLVNNPDVQTRAQKEIDQMIGSRQPKLDDRDQCPYIESMILELLRYISHIPLAIPHRAVCDTTLAGYQIPAGTQVSCNLFALHHSKFWDAPYEFRPDRFLGEDGKVVPTDHPLRKHLLPFGAGRRGCIGDNMVRFRIFLFASTILQRYNLLQDEKMPRPDDDPRNFIPGVACSPENFSMKIVDRSCVTAEE